MIPARRNVIVPLGLIVLVMAGVVAWLSWNSTRPVLAPIGPARVQPQIACGHLGAIVLAPDGSLWGCGINGLGTLSTNLPFHVPRPRRMSAQTNWIAVALCSRMAAAVKDDGTLWTWGADSVLRTGSPAAVSEGFQRIGEDRDWLSVSASGARILALRRDGTVWTWGPDFPNRATGGTYGSDPPIQLGTNSNWIATPVGSYHSSGVQRDGSLWSLGRLPLKTPPTRVGSDSNWVSARGGWTRFSLLRKDDGSWWVWGANLPFQQEILPTIHSSTQLVRLPQTERWEVVAVGFSHVLGLTRNGAMRGLGFNDAGQLGDGTTSNRSTPVEISSDKAWVAVGAGRGFSVALAADGSLWAWGNRLGDVLSERSRFIRTLGAWANRLGLRVTWADDKPPRFDTKPRCILQFTTNAPARPK